MALNAQTEEDKRIMALVDSAFRSRNVFESVYNKFLDLAMPWRPRVGEKATAENPRAPSEQDDIFDTTLQEAVEDWASDCADEFTPNYKPWTRYKVVGGVKAFSKDAQQQIKNHVADYMEQIYDDIRDSAFETQSEGFYSDLAIAPSGMDVEFTPSGQPLKFEHVPISELAILPSPFGGPGDRFRQREVQIRFLSAIWPNTNWSKLGDERSRAKNTETVTITQAYTRDWSNRSEEIWTERLLCNGRIMGNPKTERGRGSCRLIVARPRVSAPSGMGIGYANKGIAPARVLNTIGYQELKRNGRVLDPPYLFSDDGTLNLEGGIEDGEWYEAGEGFVAQSLAPDNDVREAWFKEEDLREAVRRSLFQDYPQQKGDTPPTLGQWMDETARVSRRKGFPRAAIVNEFVLPVLWRVEWVKRRRGELKTLEIDGKTVQLEPISPMSRASDIDEVQMADRHMSMFADRLGPEALEIYYDLPQTMENSRVKLGTSVLALSTPDEVERKLEQRAAREAAASGQMPSLPDGQGV